MPFVQFIASAFCVVIFLIQLCAQFKQWLSVTVEGNGVAPSIGAACGYVGLDFGDGLVV
jgi:uncharacterized membrane protein (DUF485 family)